MSGRHAVPASCPVCSGTLHVTRVTCADCGTEISGAFAPCRCGAPAPETPADPPAEPAPSASVRDQVLAQVASGELGADVAADLLAQLPE